MLHIDIRLHDPTDNHSRLSLAARLFERTLLLVAAADLSLGGNGYLFTVGGLRLREILFLVCVPWAALRFTALDRIRLDGGVLLVFTAFAITTFLGAVVGYVNDESFSAIASELKPLSYFPMLLFFSAAIRTPADANAVIGVIVAGGTVVGLAYLAGLGAAWSGIISHADVFNTLSGSDEFMFRHAGVDTQAPFVGFFYKGTVYVGVAAIVLLATGELRWLALTLLVAVALALTRSLWIGCLAAFIVGAATDRRRLPSLGAALLMLAVTAFLGLAAEGRLIEGPPQPQAVAPAPPSPEQTGERVDRNSAKAGSIAPPTESDQPGERVDRSIAIHQRLGDALFVLKNTTPVSAVIGKGFGAEIDGRRRIEMNYFEIFYKQGLFGFLPWAVLLGYIVVLYRRRRVAHNNLATGLLLCAVYIYATTTTLTIMTGSIGMGILFVAVASLGALARSTAGTQTRR